MSEQLKQVIYHNTIDISKNVISTRFTQRENAVTDLEFTVAFDDADIIRNININDRISVAYDDGTHGTKKVFDGYIEDKEAISSEQGRVTRFLATDSVCAVLKRMIVNLDFGTQSRIGQLNPNVDQKLSNAVLQILHDYVARVSGNPINQDKPNSFSDFKTNYWINDGYIWQETNSVKFPYLSMKYSNALEAITNLVKLYGALSFKRSIDTNGQVPYRGVHFISDEENNLLVAPVGNHDVQSTAGNQIAGLWHTYADDGLVLDVAKDVISYNFKEEAPYANLVYVSGKYKWPPNDELTENSAKYWGNTWGMGTTPLSAWKYRHPTDTDGVMVFDSTIAISKNKKSLKLMANVPNASTSAVFRGIFPDDSWESLQNIVSNVGATLPAMFFTRITGEFTKLVTPDNPAYINFTAYGDIDITNTNVLMISALGKDTATSDMTCHGFSTQFTVNKDEVTKQSIEITYDDINYAPTTKWKKNGNGDWGNINYIGFTFRKGGLLPGMRDMSLYIDDLSLSGSVIRGVTDANMWSLTEDTGDGYWIRNRRMNPEYKYPLRMFCVKDSLAFSDNLLSTPQSSDSLYLSAVAHLLQYGSSQINGSISIPLNTNIKAGQFIRLRNSSDNNFYKDSNADYKTMRVTEVTHSFSENGAVTSLELCNDLINGTVRRNNEYSEAVRALSPRWQDTTFASLFTENDWDVDAFITASRVNLSKIDY